MIDVILVLSYTKRPRSCLSVAAMGADMGHSLAKKTVIYLDLATFGPDPDPKRKKPTKNDAK